MPGTIVRVDVAVGEEVREGQVLVVIEAMKMEHQIVAEAGGVVSEVPVEVGQAVDAGMPLVVVSGSTEEASL